MFIELILVASPRPSEQTNYEYPMIEYFVNAFQNLKKSISNSRMISFKGFVILFPY